MSEVADSVGKGDGETDTAENDRARRARCRELARNGESKCKMGDVSGGVADLEEAFSVGTKDLKLLSIICSQLGNAYIDLKEYKKAVEKHQKDRALSTILNDTAGEAKASCNLSCAYRLLGCFQEAIHCSDECVHLCRRIGDKDKEALAMYSLATCYHSLAKKNHLSESEEVTEDCRNSASTNIAKAVQHYLYFLKLVNDPAKPPNYSTLRGRTYGNLGNLYYLLNNMDESIVYHQKRLEIGIQEEDTEAIVRAHSNIANAHLVGGNPCEAEKHYKEMQGSAEKIDDKVSTSKALFGLATSYSIRKNYPRALTYYAQMQQLVTELDDEDGQLKVLFGMTFANRALGRFEEARQYAVQHHKLATEMHDDPSRELAQGNIDALTELIQHQAEEGCSTPQKLHSETTKAKSPGLKAFRRISMTMDAKSDARNNAGRKPPVKADPLNAPFPPRSDDSPRADLVRALESGNRGRMNEQRAVAPSLSFGMSSQRHNTIGTTDLRVMSARDKVKLSPSLRRHVPAGPTRSVTSTSFLPDVGDMLDTTSTGSGDSPVSAPSDRSSPSRDSASSAGRRPLLADLKDNVSSGDPGEQMGLSDFLDFLDGQD